MRVARILVAAGADIVLGAHSHTQQPAEVLLVNGFAGDTGDEQAALEHVPESCRLSGVEGPPRKALVLYGMGAHVQRDLPRRPAHDAAADCAPAIPCWQPCSPLGLAPASMALAVQ